METEGFEKYLNEEMKTFGIKHSFLLSIATTSEQVRDINNFLIGVMKKNGDKRFTTFGTVHPNTIHPEDEIDYMRKNGITGIKYHNDFIKVASDDPRLDPVYEKAQAEQIPIYVHAGDIRFDFTNPNRLKNIARRFPHLILIAAHMGGYSIWDDAAYELKSTSFYFDTSSSLKFLSPEKAAALIRNIGIDRFLFGTDFPMWQASGELERLAKLPLTDDEFDKITHINAEVLLKEVRKYNYPFD